VIASRAELEERVSELDRRYVENIPVPENWGGYCVRPDKIEFWQGRSNRLHDRILFQKEGEGTWRRQRLSP